METKKQNFAKWSKVLGKTISIPNNFILVSLIASFVHSSFEYRKQKYSMEKV